VSETPPAVSKTGGALRALIGALLATGLDAALLALALGVSGLLGHARALALLVVWGIGAFVLAWLRPVRVHDPAEMRRESPLFLIALAAVPLATPALSAWAERLGVWILPGGMALRWAGVAISALGLALRIAAMSRLGSLFSPFVAVQKQHALETSGVYRWVRHPGYLGTWLASLGAILAFGSAATLPLSVALLALLYVRLRREEGVLEKRFGDAFRAYRLRTGALLPRPGRR
jgi:protein-S-isoprenylcysteine O-methyltransferase Ste14